jgi:hypothetical protein
MQLSKTLFWDTDLQQVNWDEHARFVIERVLTRGGLEDWREILHYYGLDKIKAESLQMRYLDKLTLNFCCTLFSIPKEQFRCYKQPQSIQQLWQF